MAVLIAPRATRAVVWSLLLVGCGRTGLGADDAGDSNLLTPAAADADLMKRWNAAVDSLAPSLDFHWRQRDDFPHPTFRGGSMTAYGEFTDVVARFFDTADNLAFVRQQQLQARPFLFGPAPKRTLTLCSVISQTSTSGLIDASRLKTLQVLLSKLGC